MNVYVSVPGQVDNVGDTVLRRGLLRALRPLGPLHVFVGDRSEDYLSGLDLQPGDKLYASPPEWRRVLTRAVLSGRAVYAYNAGEMVVDRAYVTSYARLAPLLALGRLRGGRSLHTGFGVRASNPSLNWVLRASLRPVDVVTWRDPLSADVVGIGKVAPDWAFLEGASDPELESFTTSRRSKRLGIALRYDRPAPTPAWLDSLKTWSRRTGGEIAVLAQIERDSARASAVATAVGGTSVTWSGHEHRQQERRLRGAYRECDVVISDRLHGLVMAATEGALPLSLTDTPQDKTVRTLAAVGLGEHFVDRTASEDADVLGEAVDRASQARSSSVAKVIAARGDLAALSSELLKMRERR